MGILVPLSLSTAKAAKSMPTGKGTYGSKEGRPAKKKMSPAMAKKAAEMKAKGKKKAPAKGAKKEVPAFLKKKSKKK